MKIEIGKTRTRHGNSCIVHRASCIVFFCLCLPFGLQVKEYQVMMVLRARNGPDGWTGSRKSESRLYVFECVVIKNEPI